MGLWNQYKNSCLILLVASGLSFSAFAEDPSLLHLHPEYHGEEKGQSKATDFRKVQYFQGEDRSKNLLLIKNGKMFTRDQTPVSTHDAVNTYADGSVDLKYQKAIVVLDQNDRIYFSAEPKSFSIHHSSLVGGESVKFAGELTIKNGVLIGVTDVSGHYTPSLKHTHAFLKHLEERGVDLSKVQLRTSEGMIQEFLTLSPNPSEMLDFIQYSLEDALTQASHERQPLWFTKQIPAIQSAFDHDPQRVIHLFDQLKGTYLSSEIQEFLLPYAKKHATQLFSDSERLGNFARIFHPDLVGQTLIGSTQKLLAKAADLGLQSLNPVELKQIALTRLMGKRLKLPIARKIDEKILKMLDHVGAQDLDLFYDMLITNKVNSYNEVAGQLKSSIKLFGASSACDIHSVLKNVFMQN